MPRPDVAIVSPYPTAGQRHAGPSGVASYAANLAHALSSEGVAVEVIAPVEANAPEEPGVSRDGDVVVRRSFERGMTGLVDAGRAAAATGAPVVHVQHEMFLYGGPHAVPALVPALAALRRRTRPVVTLHQVVDGASVDRTFTAMHRVRIPAPVARAALEGVQRSVVNMACATIVHEPPFAQAAPGAVVIPHGVEERTTPDRVAARRHLDLDDRLVVLCFGFVAPYKGLEVALEAGRLLGSDRAQVVVAGGPHPRLAADGDPYAVDLAARYAGRGARFTGWVPEADVDRWFAAADVAVFAYPAPFSSSGALALALAHGTPVLLSEPMARCVGAPERLAVPLDPIGLAARLGQLASPEERELLRSCSSVLAGPRTWPAVAREHVSVYERVARSRPSPHREEIPCPAP